MNPRRHLRTAAAGLLVLGLVGLYTSLLTSHDSLFLANWGVDFGDYWLAGSRVLHGQSPYAPDMLQGPLDAMGQDRFRYPPPFALAIAPLALLPLASAKLVWAALSGAGLFTGCWLAASAGGAPRTIGRAFWTVIALGIFLPVFLSLYQGNVEGLEVLALGLALGGIPVVASVAVLALGLLKIAPVLVWPAAAIHFKLALWRSAALVGAILLATLPLLWQAWHEFPIVLINQLGGSSDYLANMAPAQLAKSLAPGSMALESAVRVATLAICTGLFLASVRYSRQAGGWPSALFAALVSSLLLPSTIWFHYLVLLLPFAFFVWPSAERLGRLLIILGLQSATAALIFPPAGALLAAPLVIVLMAMLHKRGQGLVMPQRSVA